MEDNIEFDYKSFATNLSHQCKKLIPEEIKGEDRVYIVNKVAEYSNIAGETLYNDESITCDLEEYAFLVQIIAEWTFHKSIDLIKGGIDVENREFVLQKIAYKIKVDEYTIVTINEGFKNLKPEEQEDTPKDELENESKRYLRRMLLEPNYENEEEKFSENDYLTAENSSTPTEPEEEEINDNPDDKSRIVAQIGDIITKYPSVNKFLYNLI